MASRRTRPSQEWLSPWRDSSGNSQAQLVLVGHSMGRLMARYFVEALGGWRDTKVVSTFGTPFYGTTTFRRQSGNVTFTGRDQPTRQSARVDGGIVTVVNERGGSDESGDGTVPLLSAALSSADNQRTFLSELAERHEARCRRCWSGGAGVDPRRR